MTKALDMIRCVITAEIVSPYDMLRTALLPYIKTTWHSSFETRTGIRVRATDTGDFVWNPNGHATKFFEGSYRNVNEIAAALLGLEHNFQKAESSDAKRTLLQTACSALNAAYRGKYQFVPRVNRDGDVAELSYQGVGS